MKYLKKYVWGFLYFWYDFLIGDCWQLALGTAAVLALVGVIASVQPSAAVVLGPLLAVGVVAVLGGVVWLEAAKKARGH